MRFVAQLVKRDIAPSREQQDVFAVILGVRVLHPEGFIYRFPERDRVDYAQTKPRSDGCSGFGTRLDSHLWGRQLANNFCVAHAMGALLVQTLVDDDFRAIRRHLSTSVECISPHTTRGIAVLWPRKEVGIVDLFSIPFHTSIKTQCVEHRS